MVKEMVKNSSIQNAACPAMFHPNLHTRNIFVSDEDPTVVSAIIDWQSTSIEPAFWYADATPDFALPQPISDPSEEQDTMEPKSEAYAKAYNACIHFLAPKLSAVRSIHEAYLRPFRYCHRTWEDSAAAFREELIQTSRLWEELGFAVPCPFPFPCFDEIAHHRKEYRFFEAAIQLRRGLEKLLDTPSDGWVPVDEWEGTRSKHCELFEEMRRGVCRNKQLDNDEPIRSEEDLRQIWPFDL
jgi:hypothetical protein